MPHASPHPYRNHLQLTADASRASSELSRIRKVLGDPKFLDECSRRTSRSSSEIRARIETSLSEAAVAFELLQDIDLNAKRVLEIGAGVGIVSLVLSRSGIEVVAIEPGLGGFDQNALIGRCLREWIGDAGHPYLSIGAAELAPKPHGLFDVVFSINVLEHIPDLERAIGAMCSVLRPTGIMRHTCPNYLIPYEPHFGIPLVPLFPRLTAWLMPGIRKTELWRSLNFVTLGRMRRAFERQGCSCRFARGTMRTAFERLDHDEEFRKRQGGRGTVAAARKILDRFGLLELVGYLPPILSTPMTFEVVPKSRNRHQ